MPMLRRHRRRWPTCVAAVVLSTRAARGCDLQPQALVGVLVDIARRDAGDARHCPAPASGIALMLLFNIGAAALLLPLRTGHRASRCSRASR